ncbi:hypothetical protein [Streptomyces sp. NPDC007063]|uniref:hypothetical protein n=1 Tax=Streptomyces sp. NPDC007063 TaxID=3364772 RepID=UPI00369E70E9
MNRSVRFQSATVPSFAPVDGRPVVLSRSGAQADTPAVVSAAAVPPLSTLRRLGLPMT